MKEPGFRDNWVDFLKRCLIVLIFIVAFFAVILPVMLYFQVMLLLEIYFDKRDIRKGREPAEKSSCDFLDRL